MLRTALLLGALTGLIVLIGQWLGGLHGFIIAFVFAVLINFGSYWFSDKLILSTYSARQVNESEAPTLYRIAHNLALQNGIPVPRLYVIPADAANAFATGRNPQHAAIAVTEGILRLMDERELTGILAHELSHVKNRDILISSIAATLAGVVMMIAQMAQWAALFGGAHGSENYEGSGGSIFGLLVTTIAAPLVATIIQRAISRTQEYEADENGAHLSGDPLGLASALDKLSVAAEQIPLHASPHTAHLFMVSPFSRRSLMQLFSTHPPLAERIGRLQAMAGRRA